jgi:hypothetical protein
MLVGVILVNDKEETMRRFMVGAMLVLMTALLLFSFSSNAVASDVILAGGGPAPECMVSYSTYPASYHGNPGEDVHMQISNSCSATATVYWSQEDVTVVNINPSDPLVGPNDVVVSIPANAVPDIYAIYLDSTNGIANYHIEARLAVGNLPAQPVELSLSAGQPFWVSYSDYTGRILAVAYTLTNVGANDAHAVWLIEGQPTNGVELSSGPTSLVADLLPVGGSVSRTRYYQIPVGVDKFRTSLGAQAEDPNGNVLNFGSVPPEA